MCAISGRYEYKNKGIDTLIHGCTHFSLLHEHIKPYFKNDTCDETEKVDLRDLLTASKTL
mgnify:CR=1 FL=1